MLKLLLFSAFVCANNDYSSVTVEWSRTYCPTEHVPVCTVGDYDEDSDQHVCCESATAGQCIVWPWPWGCPAAFWHVCDI